jgi:DNA-binding NarL/FixJ family response regulator
VFDGIISDLMMPGGTGLDLYLWVQGSMPRLADRFIIWSGGGPTDLVERVRKAAVPLLEKTDIQVVRQAIQNLVGERGPRSSEAPR